MKRAGLKYLFFGGLAGWFIGYIFALISHGWFFYPKGALLICSAGGAIFTALLYNAVMMVDGYSNRLRYAITGGLIGAVLACIGGFIHVRGFNLPAISFQDGLVFEWALIHCGIIIGIIGFLLGSRADRQLLYIKNK